MSPCAGVLFAYFLTDERVHFAVSRDSYRFAPLNSGSPIPPLLPANGTSVRDPFIGRAPDGTYHLVSTDGANFGEGVNVLHWHSKDLISWSVQRTLPLMAAYAADVAATWAPEWVLDEATNEFVVFWASSWKNNAPAHFGADCDNTDMKRFSFWQSRTADWQSFSKPTLLVDTQCHNATYAPCEFGDGGIDGDILRGPDGRYHLFYKDSRAPHSEGVVPMQKTSGVRFVSSADLRSWSTPPQPSGEGLVGPWGVEGPELLVVNDTLRLYFDCTFQPVPAGRTRAPYGVATAPYPQGLSDPTAWKVAPGSCTGNSSSTSFPDGATHGTFLCVDEAQYAALEAVWGNSSSVEDRVQGPEALAVS